jgi:hypothetical protein
MANGGEDTYGKESGLYQGFLSDIKSMAKGGEE